MQTTLSFDDVSLLPQYSEVLPSETVVDSYLTKQIKLSIPLISAAMDTVTESQMAIAMAQNGGIGIIHKNMSVADQVEQVQNVKKFEGGIIENPITLNPRSTVSAAMAIKERYGFSHFPVIKHLDRLLVGMIGSNHLLFAREPDITLIKDVMIPTENLVLAHPEMSRAEAMDLMYENKLKSLPIVDSHNILRGLITLKDCLLNKTFPQASRDSDGKLLVGAAVGVGEESKHRADWLITAGCNVIVVDTAHGHSKGVIEMVEWLKDRYPLLQVIAGNIVTSTAAKALCDAGVDAIKVGIGPGSICTTRIIAGVGVPQFTALQNVAMVASVPIICDGGIRYSGDIAKAFVAGADTIMIGSLFAGTEEAPGEVELYHGRSYKSYRGMGSLGAMSKEHGSRDRYGQIDVANDKLVPEGIEGRVPYRGSVSGVIHQLIGGLRASLGYCGCKNLDEMYLNGQYVQVTTAGLQESHVHDTEITKESPNYWY